MLNRHYPKSKVWLWALALAALLLLVLVPVARAQGGLGPEGDDSNHVGAFNFTLVPGSP